MIKIVYVFLILLLNVGCVGNSKQTDQVELNKNEFIQVITFLKKNQVDSIEKHLLVNNKDIDSISLARILREGRIILDSYEIDKIIRDSICIIDSIDIPDLDEHMYIYGLNFHGKNGEYSGKIHMTFHSDFKNKVLNFFASKRHESSNIDWDKFDRQVEAEMRIYDSLNEIKTGM